MTLVLIEVPDEAAVQVLSRQKGVRVVQIIAAGQRTVEVPAVEAAQIPVKSKWAGTLSDADADSLRTHTEQIRAEWERIF